MIIVRKISRIYRFYIQEALNPHISGALMEFLSLMCTEMDDLFTQVIRSREKNYLNVSCLKRSILSYFFMVRNE